MLDLSLNVHFLESVRSLRALLDEFQELQDCPVSFHVISGGSSWRTLAYYAMYGCGADVSEIGSTWINGFVDIGSLRPFSDSEVAELGGMDSFYPLLWQPNVSADGKVWGIPFLTDVRVVYYWRDMLSRSGVDESSAFQSVEQFEETLNSLTRVCMTPWGAQSLIDTHDVIYNSACWVWSKGGDFLDPDGRRSAFNDPEAREGLEAYFKLHSYMPSHRQPLNMAGVVELFAQRKIAVMINGPWAMDVMQREHSMDELVNQVGIAVPPGTTFVGGPQLAIWKHNQEEARSFELVKYLLSPSVQMQIGPLSGMLPALRAVAEDPSYAEGNVYHDVFLQAMKAGRNPALMPNWGFVEEKLATAYGQIMGALWEDPDLDVSSLLDRVLNPLGAYFDRCFANRIYK